MKKLPIVINSFVLLFIILSGNLFAHTIDHNKLPSKQWTLGAGTHALVMDSYFTDNEYEFHGAALSSSYYLNSNWGFRAQYYTTEEDNNSSLEISGVEINSFWGTNLDNYGFKWYVGAGYYSETLEYQNGDKDNSGLQLFAGLGHNWERISIDLSIAYRNESEYHYVNDRIGIATSISITSLIISYRY